MSPARALLVKLPVISPQLQDKEGVTDTPTPDHNDEGMSEQDAADMTPSTTVLGDLLTTDSAIGTSNPIFNGGAADRSVINVEEFLRFACRRTNAEMTTQIRAAHPTSKCDEIKLRLILCDGLGKLAQDRNIPRDKVKKAFEEARNVYGATQRRWHIQRENIRDRNRKRYVKTAAAKAAAAAAEQSRPAGKKPRKIAPAVKASKIIITPKAPRKRADTRMRTTFETRTEEEEAAEVLIAIHQEALAILRSHPWIPSSTMRNVEWNHFCNVSAGRMASADEQMTDWLLASPEADAEELPVARLM